MKILIVNSPLFRNAQKHCDEDSLPPIGLGYIATHLQNNNVSVEILDSVVQKISLGKLKSEIIKVKPKFLGINIFSTNYLLVKNLIESLRFKVHVIIGGLSTNSLYEDILNWNTSNHIDVVIGDGELITLDIIKDKISESPIFENCNRRVFAISDNSKYFVKDISEFQLNRDFFYNPISMNQNGMQEASLVSSRGCIYNCSFCAAARELNKDFPVRERSRESIINELSEIKNNYPETKYIRILDDLFLKSKESLLRAVEIFQRFDFQWRSMAHIRTFNQVNHDDLSVLKESGCYELFIGIESGSSKILRSINKTHNKDLIVKNITKIFQAGINVKGYLIYGFPNESIDDMEMTYQLAQGLKEISVKYKSNFRASVFQFRPYHGTAIYKLLQEKHPSLNIHKIKPNKRLSRLVGRKQFNFHGNNFSNVRLKTIHDYICKTNMI